MGERLFQVLLNKWIVTGHHKPPFIKLIDRGKLSPTNPIFLIMDLFFQKAGPKKKEKEKDL